jgi:hypothetical protein
VPVMLAAASFQPMRPQVRFRRAGVRANDSDLSTTGSSTSCERPRWPVIATHASRGDDSDCSFHEEEPDKAVGRFRGAPTFVDSPGHVVTPKAVILPPTCRPTVLS